MNLAIESQTEAVMKISNDHASKSKWLNNLGNSYHLRYEHLSQSEDLDKALDYLDQATSLVPENHPDKYAWLYNLHRPYYSRFQARHDPSDLDKAISCQMQAVAFAPKTYAYSAELLEKLGELHQCRFEQSSRHTDLNAAIECFRDSATFSAGFPTIRLEAAHKWAKLCHKVHRSAIEAYTQAMALIPQVAWIGSTTSRRYEYLISHIKHLANEAAVAAIGSGQYALAVEWLEEGRSIVWGQMLQLRTPFDDLSVQDPRLAKELQQVALEVDLASSMNPGRVGVVLTSATSEQVAQSRRRSAERWESLLKDARHLHGFERFLKPKQFSDLKSTSATSTVVLINMHEEQCDALAILPESTDPVHISLPAFSYVKAIQSRHIMDTIQHTRARCNLQQRKPVFLEDDPPDTLENTLNVLWSDIVRPILEHLGYITTRNPADELPRITWCATGLLAFLPLHAAEYYHGNTKERVFDYVVSSYSPTLSALLAPVQPTAQFAGVLGVGEAAPKSAIPLPGTIAELDQLEQIVGSHGVPFTRLDEDRATCDAVLEQIEEHSWVHLACHASQDLFDPTMSSFQLHGGSLSLAAISSKSLKQAQFAFLSACETATGHKQLPDESIHLAAGMIMVGYQAAIATMWSIKDEDAPLVSTKVYKKLLQGGIPQSQRAAVALHEAMAELRGLIGEKEFVRWVPYIHVGK
ncbi:hypothetical protein FRC12_004196 [Ceratobasidium sp. 428]|nr:hypothetical protein FRC12_004196 [Ceratobasidium sp. 428]